MKKIFNCLMILPFVCFAFKSFSQAQGKIDSLKKIISLAKEDTTRVNTLNALSFEYGNSNADSAIYFSDEALALATKTNYKIGIADAHLRMGTPLMLLGKYEDGLKNLNKAIEIYDDLLASNKTADKSKILKQKAKAYYNIGNNYYHQDNYPEAVKNNFISLKIFEEIGDKIGIAASYNGLGNIYSNQGNYPEALKNFLAALKIREETGDKVGISQAYANVGVIYEHQGKYPEALKNYFSALKMREEYGNKNDIASTYINIGVICFDQENYPDALKNYLTALNICKESGDKLCIVQSYLDIGDIYYKQGNFPEALQNYNYSIKIAEEIADKRDLALVLDNKASLYEKQKKYSEALQNNFTALKIYEEINDKEGITHTYSNIGYHYFKQKKLTEASYYINKGLALAKETGDIQDISESYGDLAESDSANGNFKQSLEHYKLHITYRDSMVNEENTKKTVQSQMQYDFDKKEVEQKAEQDKKDAIAATRLKNQTTIRNYSLAGLGLASLVILLLFNQYRVTKKSNKLIEQQKQIAEEQKARAEESEKFKSRFLANMSHEIRTPMNAVMGMTNLVLNSKLDTQQHKYLDAVQKSSRNLLVIINDILDLSKIEAGKMELEKIDFRLHDTIDTVYNTLRFRAEEKGLKFNVTIDENVPAVLKGDPVRLNQVLINLIGNAIKFTPRGKVELIISNKVETQSSIFNLQFSISDTGIGIPKDKIDKVFEGFQQADKETFRKFGGTGLGLNISKQLTEMMGGTIVAESEQGKGTTFTLTIPFAIGSENALNIVPQKIDESLLKTLSKLRILLAEDNEFNQIVAKDTLQMIIPGITVDIANNGEEAVAKIKTKNYDLILMDINMPEMNGLEAARIIRQMQPPLNNIYIIAMTASVTKDEIASRFDAGMNDYVPKPFEQNELVEKIAKVSYI